MRYTLYIFISFLCCCWFTLNRCLIPLFVFIVFELRLICCLCVVYIYMYILFYIKRALKFHANAFFAFVHRRGSNQPTFAQLIRVCSVCNANAICALTELVRASEFLKDKRLFNHAIIVFRLPAAAALASATARLNPPVAGAACAHRPHRTALCMHDVRGSLAAADGPVSVFVSLYIHLLYFGVRGLMHAQNMNKRMLQARFRLVEVKSWAMRDVGYCVWIQSLHIQASGFVAVHMCLHSEQWIFGVRLCVGEMVGWVAHGFAL